MKRIGIVVGVVILALLSVSVAAAQGPRGGRFGGGQFREGAGVVMDIVAEATGLDRLDLISQLREEGATLTSVIEANGGDPAAVQAAVVAAIVEQTEQDQAAVEERTAQLFSREFQGRGGERGFGVMEIVSEATGLDPLALMEALREEGATLASVIEANGGDPAAVQAQVVEAIVAATGRDTAVVEALVNEMFTNEAPRFGDRGRGGGFFGGGGRGERGGKGLPFNDAPPPADTESGQQG